MCVCAEELQGNITAHQRSLELLELQETLSWPPLSSLCPDSFIPEVTYFILIYVVVHSVSVPAQGMSLDKQPCRESLAAPTRQLLHCGTLHLVDNRGRHSNDIQLFLFTDMLLLTEPHKLAGRKEVHQREVRSNTQPQQNTQPQSVHSTANSLQSI